jgi:polynucleotide 5'-triphosphatase
LSVSPKTRLPSQPRGDLQQYPENGYNMSNIAVKRKMEDREAPIEEPRRITQPEIRTQVNGDNRIPSISSTSSPKQPPKKRTRYTETPIWAQSVRGRKSVFGAANVRINPKVNGKQPAVPQPAPPPLMRAETNGHRPVTPATGPVDDPSMMLGPWERSITGKKPQEQITKIVADWLFYNVVSREDFGELASRGVEVEIEAKLGQLIDRETNHRYELPVQTECVLRETGRVNFRSSMTEVSPCYSFLTHTNNCSLNIRA